MKRVTLSDISRRDWKKITCGGTVNKLRYNYALQIQKTATKGRVREFPERAFEAIYGIEWYLQPYKKLVSVAKMMPVKNMPLHTPYEFSKMEREEVKRDIAKHAMTIGNNPYYKAAKRVFTKKELERFVGKYSYANGAYTVTQMGYAVMGYRHMRKTDKKLARKVKEMNKAMDKFLRYNANIQNLYDGRLNEIPEYLRAKIEKDYRYYAIYEAMNDEDSWRRPMTFELFEYGQLNEMLWNAAHSKWACDKKLQLCKMCKAMERYYKDKEIIDALQELGLEPDSYNQVSVTKLNTKFRMTVRTVMRSKVSDDAKRTTIIQLANSLREKYPPCRVNGWVPTLRTVIKIEL